jgi:glycosyltransferase involved in cell wall biosynthesis
VFTGTRLDIAAILSQAAVSVVSSLSEGLSNVILESMAAGVPVVATRVGGTPELLDEGVSGILVPPCDAPAMAAAIERLLGDSAMARRMGNAGRERAVTRFSMPSMVSRTESYYDTLLRGERCTTRDADGSHAIPVILSPPPAVLARRRSEMQCPASLNVP